MNKKPIVLYCLTNRPEVLVSAPIRLAGHSLPEWWKSLPVCTRSTKKLGPLGTMKNCVGFTGLYQHGVIMPMWCDLALMIAEQGRDYFEYQYADLKSEAQTHGAEQHNHEFPAADYQHIKLNSPWQFVCEEPVTFLLNAPTWSMLKYDTINIMPGALQFNHQPYTNINMFIRRKSVPQQLMIPYLQPIAHIVPLSERPLKIVVSDQEKLLAKTKYMHAPVTFVRSYKNFVRAVTGRLTDK